MGFGTEMTPLAYPLLELGSKLIDRFFPDETKKAEAQLELMKMAEQRDFQLILEQINVNKAEAQNPNLFVSGWRPGAGWTCVAALAYTFVLQPLLSWASLTHGWQAPPSINSDDLLYLLGALLGIGGFRSYEKIKGVA